MAPGSWNLVPVGESSGFGVGTDVLVVKHLEDNADIFARLGEVYIVVEGGTSVSQQARTSVASGALVLLVARSGGASAGMFDFPTSALKRPVHATFDTVEFAVGCLCPSREHRGCGLRDRRDSAPRRGRHHIQLETRGADGSAVVPLLCSHTA